MLSVLLGMLPVLLPVLSSWRRLRLCVLRMSGLLVRLLLAVLVCGLGVVPVRRLVCGWMWICLAVCGVSRSRNHFDDFSSKFVPWPVAAV
jgi:hypothetical protein